MAEQQDQSQSEAPEAAKDCPEAAKDCPEAAEDCPEAAKDYPEDGCKEKAAVVPPSCDKEECPRPVAAHRGEPLRCGPYGQARAYGRYRAMSGVELAPDTGFNIFDILQFLRDCDLGQIQQLVALIGQFGEEQALRERVRTAVAVLRTITAMTPTDVDDKIVAVIDAGANDQMLDALVRLVATFRGVEGEVVFKANDAETFKAKGIPWSEVIRLAQKVIELIDMYTSRR